MNTATKLSVFALALATVFGAAYGTGQLTGPVRTAADSDSPHPAGHDELPDPAGQPRLPGGLLVSDHGYTLTLVPTDAAEFAFQVTGPDKRPVTRYDVEHDKRMHLIVARRDLSGFRHVHPEMDPDGTWRVPAPLSAPGSWRAFADFKPTGAAALTLGIDVSVPGAYQPRPLPAPTSTTNVDGYVVRLDGILRPGQSNRLTLTVSRDGTPVTDLQPYLGAYGHLVALRDGDLAYLHVHPEGAPGDGRTPAGPGITFFAEVPSVGAYRLYLDFRHAGTVRTAEFTLNAADEPSSPPSATAGPPDATPGPPSATAGPPSDPDHGHN